MKNKHQIKRRVRGKMRECYDVKIGDCWNEMYQVLEEQRPFLFGLFNHWVIIDTEEVPSFAWIQSACFGSTDWKSKFINIEGVEFIK